MPEPLFLTLAEILEIHNNQVKVYGGKTGLRDLGLLQSAMAQPQASFGGKFLNEDLYTMAAYAFHIAQNHPFIDGNKRTGLVAALVFLEMNHISIHDPKQKLLKGMLEMAEGKIDKIGLAQILRSLRTSGKEASQDF